MSERDKFEAHTKGTAWYQVLSEAAKDDDEGASAFRMARMAASEAWQASRRAALEEAASRVAIHSQYPITTDFDRGYDKARKDAANSICSLAASDSDGGAA